MAKIDIKCDECGHEARVPEAFRGKKVRCLRCRAKLRVPGDPGGPPSGPVVTLDEERASTGGASRSRGSRETKPPANREEKPPRGVVTPGAGGVSSKVRREVQQAIREILGDYEHAIEDSPRGFVVDLRGVAFGLARTLVEDLIATPGVRDAKLAGGTGECRITITLEGAVYDPDDSFADDDDDTEIFRRPTASDVRSPLDGSQVDAAVSEKPRSRATKDPDRSDQRATRAKDRSRDDRADDQGSRNSREETRSGTGELDRLLNEGRDLIAQGDVQAAIVVLEKAVRVDKNHKVAVSSLGQAYARAGDWERARRAFKHLTALTPDDADAHIYHAAAAMDCERLDDARDALSLAVKLSPDNAKAYKYAAKLYERTGDTARAQKFRAKYEQLKGR
ncbi:MAG: tetratricopeptide repeat protein [Planctomycetota bacterium]